MQAARVVRYFASASSRYGEIVPRLCERRLRRARTTCEETRELIRALSKGTSWGLLAIYLRKGKEMRQKETGEVARSDGEEEEEEEDEVRQGTPRLATYVKQTI